MASTTQDWATCVTQSCGEYSHHQSTIESMISYEWILTIFLSFSFSLWNTHQVHAGTSSADGHHLVLTTPGDDAIFKWNQTTIEPAVKGEFFIMEKKKDSPKEIDLKGKSCNELLEKLGLKRIKVAAIHNGTMQQHYQIRVNDLEFAAWFGRVDFIGNITNGDFGWRLRNTTIWDLGFVFVQCQRPQNKLLEIFSNSAIIKFKDPMTGMVSTKPGNITTTPETLGNGTRTVPKHIDNTTAHDGLSVGEIAGIVVGIALALVICVVYIIYRRCTKKGKIGKSGAKHSYHRRVTLSECLIMQR